MCVKWAGRKPGQDIRTVLAELCNLDGEELAQLESDGIIFCGEEDESAAAPE